MGILDEFNKIHDARNAGSHDRGTDVLTISSPGQYGTLFFNLLKN